MQTYLGLFCVTVFYGCETLLRDPRDSRARRLDQACQFPVEGGGGLLFCNSPPFRPPSPQQDFTCVERRVDFASQHGNGKGLNPLLVPVLSLGVVLQAHTPHPALGPAKLDHMDLIHWFPCPVVTSWVQQMAMLARGREKEEHAPGSFPLESLRTTLSLD